MTSKEALNNLIEELKWCCNDGVELTDYDKSMIEPIQRDLEILEIFRKNIKGSDLLEIKISYYEDDFDKIVGWLNNEI